MNSVQKQYFREIRRLLPCHSAEKKRYLAEFDHGVSSYVQNTPNTSYEDLCTRFGSPQAIVEAYVEHNSKQISRRATGKKLIILVSICTAICVIVLITISAKVAISLNEIEAGYFITEIVEDSSYSEEALPIIDEH